MFGFLDDLGPEKVLHVARPALGLKAIVVVDNTAAGPAIGGTRMAKDVTVEECFRLARAMTLKNAAAGLAHGGAKSVIVGDPSMPAAEKEQTIRAFARSLRDLSDYIPGPDMGTNEQAMAWIKDEIGRSVGLPRVIGGIPLDEIGATGFGLAVAAEAAEAHGGPRIAGARVVVQGFGAVGQHAARFLAAKGAVLVAASDSHAAVADPAGLDIEALIALKRSGGSFAECSNGQKMGRDEVVGVACDIWIPAARPDVLNAQNIGKLQAKLLLQGANIPATLEAEQILHSRGVLSIPDFIANAGGVICASVEYHGGTEKAAFDTIAEKIAANTHEVLTSAKADRLLPRDAAVRLAERRIRSAMALRRWR
ncbi:MAG: Glu/Leu/Phe/Val family dehydrogenase [Hyphomicrobiaceae bacterium]